MKDKEQLKSQNAKTSDLYQDLATQILGLMFHGAMTLGAGALTFNEIASDDRKMSNVGMFLMLAIFMAYRSNEGFENVRRVVQKITQIRQQNVKTK